jgi:hypothetical protein
MTATVRFAGTGTNGGPALKPAAPQTHGLTVLGWVVVCFSSMPITMGFSGDGRAYAVVGLVMLGCGVAMVIVGKRLGRPGPG